MGELIEKHGNLSAQDAEWLHLLVGDWQVISDLAFADLVLWMPDREGDFLALAHARPSTGATVHHDEVVGGPVPERSEEHTSELQSRFDLVCRLLLEKK